MSAQERLMHVVLHTILYLTLECVCGGGGGASVQCMYMYRVHEELVRTSSLRG